MKCPKCGALLFVDCVENLIELYCKCGWSTWITPDIYDNKDKLENYLQEVSDGKRKEC